MSLGIIGILGINWAMVIFLFNGYIGGYFRKIGFELTRKNLDKAKEKTTRKDQMANAGMKQNNNDEKPPIKQPADKHCVDNVNA